LWPGCLIARASRDPPSLAPRHKRPQGQWEASSDDKDRDGLSFFSLLGFSNFHPPSCSVRHSRQSQSAHPLMVRSPFMNSIIFCDTPFLPPTTTTIIIIIIIIRFRHDHDGDGDRHGGWTSARMHRDDGGHESIPASPDGILATSAHPIPPSKESNRPNQHPTEPAFLCARSLCLSVCLSLSLSLLLSTSSRSFSFIKDECDVARCDSDAKP